MRREHGHKSEILLVLRKEGEVEMTREERAKLRSVLLYVADCMLAVDEMQSQHNCNDCGLKRECAYVPKLGQPVRWNCPLWQKRGGKE